MPDPDRIDNQLDKISSLWSLGAFYVQKSGTLTAGVVIVLAMWLLIAKPELDRKTYEKDRLRAIVAEIEEEKEELRLTVDEFQRTLQDFRALHTAWSLRTN